MPEPRLSRSTRRTVSTYSVSGVDTMKYTSPVFFRTLKVVPFEVDLTWNNGQLDSVCVVHAWIMRNGVPHRAVTIHVNDWARPMWLDDLVREVTEPGVQPGVQPAPRAVDPTVGVEPTDWEYNQIGCDFWQVHHLCNRWNQEGGWEPVAVFNDRIDAEVPSEIGIEDSDPASAVLPVKVLFRRPVPVDTEEVDEGVDADI